MEGFIKLINQGWVGILIGAIVAIIAHKRASLGPRLVYQWSSLKVIGTDKDIPDDIRIIFKGIEVPRVIKTNIIIWNSGNKMLDGKNRVQGDPLRLEFNANEEIISANIITKTKEVNGFEIVQDKKNPNILYFEFDYLDPKDGASIEVIHTDIDRYPKVKGVIKGMPNGLLNWSVKRKSNKKLKGNIQRLIDIMIRFKIIPFSALIIGLFCTSVGTLGLMSTTFPNVKVFSEFGESTPLSTSYLVIGVLYLLMCVSFWIKRRRYPKSLNLDKTE